MVMVLAVDDVPLKRLLALLRRSANWAFMVDGMKNAAATTMAILMMLVFIFFSLFFYDCFMKFVAKLSIIGDFYKKILKINLLFSDFSSIFVLLIG